MTASLLLLKGRGEGTKYWQPLVISKGRLCGKQNSIRGICLVTTEIGMRAVRFIIQMFNDVN